MVFGAVGRFFGRLKDGLSKTRSVLGDALRAMVGKGRRIDQSFLDDLELQLLAADIGVSKTEEIIAELQQRYKDQELAAGDELIDLIKHSLRQELHSEVHDELHFAAEGPTVVLVVGVNGTGKTTSIAKLAKRFKDQGRSVLIAACDTYRAAAIEQLETWAARVDVELIKQQANADAAAVAFDAIAAAQARASDIVLIDTAGRLHNKEHLMRELEKLQRVIQRRIPEAPHDTLLVLDATAGQNALQQAKVFADMLGLSGIVLTKLDGTAKGGVAIPIRRELGLPVRYIGVGEGMEDLQPFDADSYLEAILGSSGGDSAT